MAILLPLDSGVQRERKARGGYATVSVDGTRVPCGVADTETSVPIVSFSSYDGIRVIAAPPNRSSSPASSFFVPNRLDRPGPHFGLP
eukprot:COSAG05_NODE_6918_length_881_cov_2.066496_1_plen_87_part_00